MHRSFSECCTKQKLWVSGGFDSLLELIKIRVLTNRFRKENSYKLVKIATIPLKALFSD